MPETNDAIPDEVALAASAIVRRLLVGGCINVKVEVIGAENYGRDRLIRVGVTAVPTLTTYYHCFKFAQLETANFDIAYAVADDILAHYRKAHARISGEPAGKDTNDD